MVSIIQAHQMDWHRLATQWRIIHSTQNYQWKRFAKTQRKRWNPETKKETIIPIIISVYDTHSAAIRLVYVSSLIQSDHTLKYNQITVKFRSVAASMHKINHNHNDNHYDGNCTFI